MLKVAFRKKTFKHSAGGVVLNHKGEVLLVAQRNRTWSLPKGGIKEGEDPREAATREVTEETGVKNLRLVKLLKSYSRYSLANTGQENTDKLKRITMYLFTTDEVDLRPMDLRNPEAKWVPKEDVLQHLSHPKDKEFFRSILADI